MIRLAVVWWLPEGDQPGALEVGVTDCTSLEDLVLERREMPCQVLELLEYEADSIPGSIDGFNQLSAFMNIEELDPNTIQYVVLHVITDVLNRMLKNYQWDPVKQEITPRT
jgi:hypothetical protein